MAAKRTEFINNELGKAFFANPNKAFPNMDFVKRGMRWESPLKHDLTPSHDKRKDKCVITQKLPLFVLEQGGGSVSYVDLYMMQNNKDFRTALEELASLYGLVAPNNYNAEEWKEQQRRQDEITTIAAEMEEALFSPQGEKVLQYLHGRGYKDGLIHYGHLGLLTSSAADKLRRIMYNFPSGVERENPLAIPYISQGNIYGVVFRRIDGKKEGAKYKDAFITEKDTKKYHLYGLDALTTNSNNLTIVEGELDALRAQYMGIPNVVAASGSSLCDEAVEEIKRHGIRSVILLFDTDEAKTEQEKEKRREETEKKINKCYEILRGNDIDVYIAEFPQGENGEKVDTDSYLNTHTPEELKKLIINKATPIALYMGDKLLARYGKMAKEEGDSYPLFDSAKQDIIHAALYYTEKATERQQIYDLFTALTGQAVNASNIAEEAEKMRQDMLKKEQERQMQVVRDTFSRMVNNGQIEAAEAYMKEELAKMQTANADEKYSARLFKHYTKEERRQRRSEQPQGLLTPYTFRSKSGEYQPLLLPSGALTYICGQTSHGKTKMLENLALHLATTDEGEGDVLYFSYEEAEVAIEEQFLNLYANIPLSYNNLRTINSYYTMGTFEYAKRDADTALFLQKADAFDAFLETDKLRIYNEYYDGRELAEAIQTYSRKSKIKAVFVDYVQRIRIKNSRLQKKEELEEICDILINAALELKIPVVLGAQLNRQAESPIDMDVTTIADASNIEHSANVVMLMWNSAVEPRGNWYKNAKCDLSFQAKRIVDRGFEPNKEGQIYAILAKNRGGERGIDAVLQFNGNTGKISPEIIVVQEDKTKDRTMNHWGKTKK